MISKEIIVIRHARSNHNIRKTDDLDGEISDFGVRQAINVGDYLSSEFDLKDYSFFTSPFLRCVQTADIISKKTNHTPIVDEKIKESLNHYNAKVLIKNHKEKFPNFVWDSINEKGIECGPEFNEHFLNRMFNFYHDLPQKSIVVTHGLPAILLINIASNPMIKNIPVWDYSIDNCSISVVKKGRIVWHGRNLYNEFDYNKELYYSDIHDLHKK